jgi:hypothetical protein
MKSRRYIRHEFVDLAPESLEEGVLYVSIKFGSAVHNCFCGCGIKVATPFTPTDWSLTFDGDTVSLWPSVGNWDLPCRSHYVIKRDIVHWAGDMTREEIEGGRVADRRRKAAYYDAKPLDRATAPLSEASKPVPERKRSFWSRLIGRR